MASLSVVMPNYNHAAFLDGSLSAVLAQTRPVAELIVVDDGSTDGSREVIARHAAADPRVRMIALEHNVGVSAATEIGLAQARGTHVALAAADDLILPRFAEEAMVAFSRWPDAGLCFSDPLEIVSADQPPRCISLALSRQPEFFTGADLARLMRHNPFNISTNTVVFRRDALAGAGGLRHALEWHADWCLTLIVALRHGAIYLPGAYAAFRLRPDSYSMGRRDAGRQRRVIAGLVARLGEPDVADVAPRLHDASVLPELSWRVLGWLAASPAGRRHLSPHLVMRLVLGGLWGACRRVTPAGARRALRVIAGRRAVRQLRMDGARRASF